MTTYLWRLRQIKHKTGKIMGVGYTIVIVARLYIKSEGVESRCVDGENSKSNGDYELHIS